MQVGQTVKHGGKMVKILAIEEHDLATVSIWFSSDPHYEVYLSELEPVTQVAPIPQINHAALAQKTAKPTKEHFTQAFDPAMFGETGTTLYCYCGKTSRKIAPSLIKNVAMQNAAINYVISQCGYCHKPVSFSNATH